MITVQLNGEDQQLALGSNLLQAIEQWQPGPSGFAVAVNQQFVPKSRYQQTALAEGDQVELVIPMQGG